MAGQDYVPLYLPGHEISCIAGAAITAGQVVSVTAGTLSGGGVAPTVNPTSAATAALCGVAANTVASGAPVDVYFGGIHVLATAGSVSAGASVAAAASGGVAGVTDTPGTLDYSTIIGKALSANASNQVVVKLFG